MDTGIMCKRIAQPVFCHLDLCGGIVGDTQITGNTTFGNCPFENLSVAIKHLSTISYFNMIGLDKGYVHFTCPKNTACQDYMYNWDNGGWTFSNNYISIYRDSYNITNKCYLQWPASFPSNTTTSIQGTIPTTTTSGNSITTTISDSNNSKLIVGAIVGSVIFLVIVEIAIIESIKPKVASLLKTNIHWKKYRIVIKNQEFGHFKRINDEGCYNAGGYILKELSHDSSVECYEDLLKHASQALHIAKRQAASNISIGSRKTRSKLDNYFYKDEDAQLVRAPTLWLSPNKTTPLKQKVSYSLHTFSAQKLIEFYANDNLIVSREVKDIKSNEFL
ncbi:8760_t:CDS:2 [Cetraspora pellucida]|uniref:8760_t:CDS:1 n=1 Tax=Cetraspora pellucida TaxID=1433469 RepID=A0ACA9JZC6_9GLOM|nr:8760_t:CDS:2 [Cetraspora pellucida]